MVWSGHALWCTVCEMKWNVPVPACKRCGHRLAGSAALVSDQLMLQTAHYDEGHQSQPSSEVTHARIVDDGQTLH